MFLVIIPDPSDDVTEADGVINGESRTALLDAAKKELYRIKGENVPVGFIFHIDDETKKSTLIWTPGRGWRPAADRFLAS